MKLTFEQVLEYNNNDFTTWEDAIIDNCSADVYDDSQQELGVVINGIVYG